ncbi:hypothetical protein ACF1AE_25620 [Streptomyces sp. NPDC014986]|uniref:hypothetical protein n=1 Tax=Streptomyces sp. NPDC014986 TaxID=3364934 RepID=UPI0036F869C9
MAARSSRSTDETQPEQPPMQAVRPQQYSGGEGWELGQVAPEDRYRQIDDDGAFVGEAKSSASGGGRWVQVVTKGSPITPDVLRGLAPAEESEGGDA